MPQFWMQFMKWEKIKGKSRKWMENGREMPSILGGKGEREKKNPHETRVCSGPGSQPPAELTEKAAGADSLEGSSTPQVITNHSVP